MTFIVDQDATSVIAALRLLDDAGAAVTGQTFESAGASADYKLPTGTAWVSIPLVAGTLGTWASGGFVEEDGADGWYQLGLPDAAIVSGVETKLRFKTSGNGYRYGAVTAIGTGAATAEVLAKANLITARTVFLSGPVSELGSIDLIVIGDDYSSANGSAFEWTFSPPEGTTVASGTCKFGGWLVSDPTQNWLVTGTLSDAGGGLMTASFDLLRASTVNLSAGEYEWSAHVSNDAALQTTFVLGYGNRRVQLVKKQT